MGKAGKVAAEVGGKTSNFCWLYGKLRTGYTIYDVGKDANRTVRSSSYIMEKATLFLWETRNLLKTFVHMVTED